MLFDKKRKTGIIHHARQRNAQKPANDIEIHHFIYFPTPLYTKTRCQAGFCVCWGFFVRNVFYKRVRSKQRTCSVELLFLVTTPPVKIQARKVRRLSGLALYQNMIPLIIARAQRRLFKPYVPIRPDSPQSSAGPQS